LVLIAGLLLLVQASVFLAVNTANIQSARQQIDDALQITAGQFHKTIEDREQRLLAAARLMSRDYPFKQAYATGEHGTILSALENQAARVSANIMMLLTLDIGVIADTLRPELSAVPFEFPELIERAEENQYGEAADIRFFNGKPYQVVVVPLFTPAPSAWIISGFLISDVFAIDLQKHTHSHVSLLHVPERGESTVVASTLDKQLREMLPVELNKNQWDIDRSRLFSLAGQEYVYLVTTVWGNKTRGVVAVLQRSLDDALKPYRRLRNILMIVFLVGLGLSMAGGVFMARSVTKPVKLLAEGAKKIREGDYSHHVKITQRDEMGELAESFNSMVTGLAERDKVRNLLGKVVSPEVAEELLRKDIELGGEEREVTILFSDVRNFTSMCEGKKPTEVLTLLNNYLTRISAVIEEHGGVVDKYIGDAVMALFGAPLKHDNDPSRAVATALGMCDALSVMNVELLEHGLAPLGVGIGINTAEVVAGNMGSNNRLNYTVVGDGVNLASRLEGLTKQYGATVITSGSTRDEASSYVYRELDRVQVKGKKEVVSIFEPMGLDSELSDKLADELERYHQGLAAYRQRDWKLALSIFESLANAAPETRLYAVYLERIHRFRTSRLPENWTGVHTYETK